MNSRKYFCVFLVAVLSSVVIAEPTTSAVTITRLRPYNTSGWGVVYLSVSQTSLCNSNSYVIDLSWAGAKEIYAAALAAMMAGKQVQVEIDNAGCATPGWTTKVQSLVVIP
jgi:hypothetical protein